MAYKNLKSEFEIFAKKLGHNYNYSIYDDGIYIDEVTFCSYVCYQEGYNSGLQAGLERALEIMSDD